jgi:hypothetical protein
MLKILHRINSIDLLRQTAPAFGVEMDLHAFGDRIVVHHDAFTDAIDFEAWLDAYQHAFIILNVKEEGIETQVRDIVLKRGIREFFMLDLSFPALMKMVRLSESRVAIRVSEYEATVGALTLAGKATWIWLDVFHGFPIPKQQYDALCAGGFKICLVSPELHGRNSSEIATMRSYMDGEGIEIDAVCTKIPELWE